MWGGKSLAPRISGQRSCAMIVLRGTLRAGCFTAKET
ncbi:hypothetical protein PEC302107_22930 [Pectobacterium araliae]|nr:hypothetical protein PEC302107_22930 [Pectobacterium carotovorum subsp. carotovorum]